MRFVQEIQSILFLCSHNSARSQMAEGLMKNLFPNLSVYSAGTEKTSINPLSIKVMDEIGVDISDQLSKTFERFLDLEIDLVVTVCDSANETCPNFPMAKERIHVGFEDPGKVEGSLEAKLEAFRKTRDLIHRWIEEKFHLRTMQ